MCNTQGTVYLFEDIAESVTYLQIVGAVRDKMNLVVSAAYHGL